MLVGDVVGQLEFVEVDHSGHPVPARGWAVRVDVHASGHLRVRLPHHHPAGVVELISAVISRHDVHQENILGFCVHPGAAGPERREHAPAGEDRHKIV